MATASVPDERIELWKGVSFNNNNKALGMAVDRHYFYVRYLFKILSEKDHDKKRQTLPESRIKGIQP